MNSAIRKHLKRLASGAILALGVAAGAQAQQASGNIMGEAVAGDTVVVHNPAIGFHREISVEKDGKYNLRRVPIGIYEVTVKHADGSQAGPTRQIRVQSGTTARVQ